MSSDESLIATNDDALINKCSTVQAGYLTDPHVKRFLKKPQKRAPIIHRGTYTRTVALDDITTAFDGQIVSVGAGSDTRSLRLKKRLYVEIDLSAVTAKKALVLCKDKTLSSIIGPCELSQGGAQLISKSYWLIPGDLKHWEDILSSLRVLGFDFTIPTLFLSECVLVYLDPVVSNGMLSSINSHFDSVAIAIYEQILPDDRFGKTMLSNLRDRGILIPGIHAFPTLESQELRLKEAGFTNAISKDFNFIWDNVVSPQEKKRLAELEVFDEIEEWQLMSSHYCITVGFKSLSLFTSPLWFGSSS